MSMLILGLPPLPDNFQEFLEAKVVGLTLQLFEGAAARVGQPGLGGWKLSDVSPRNTYA